MISNDTQSVSPSTAAPTGDRGVDLDVSVAPSPGDTDSDSDSPINVDTGSPEDQSTGVPDLDPAISAPPGTEEPATEAPMATVAVAKPTEAGYTTAIAAAAGVLAFVTIVGVGIVLVRRKMEYDRVKNAEFLHDNGSTGNSDSGNSLSESIKSSRSARKDYDLNLHNLREAPPAEAFLQATTTQHSSITSNSGSSHSSSDGDDQIRQEQAKANGVFMMVPR